jgi:hypothetical protein
MTHLSDELIDLAAEGGELSPNERDHLLVCAECRGQVARIQALGDRLAALPRISELPQDGWYRVRHAIDARRVRRRVLTSSAVFALAAALLLAVVRVFEPPEIAPVAANEMAEVRAVVLPQIADAMAINLTVYDAALAELEAAAAADPENFELRQRIDDLRRKRSALLRQASIS